MKSNKTQAQSTADYEKGLRGKGLTRHPQWIPKRDKVKHAKYCLKLRNAYLKESKK